MEAYVATSRKKDKKTPNAVNSVSAQLAKTLTDRKSMSKKA